MSNLNSTASAFLAVLLCGCSSLPANTADRATKRIELYDEPVRMREEVLRYVPIGTTVEQARATMEKSGFVCSSRLPSKDKPYLHFTREKQLDFFVAKKWMINMPVKDGRVTEVTVTTGYIGP